MKTLTGGALAFFRTRPCAPSCGRASRPGHIFFRRSEPFETNGYDDYYYNSDGSLVRRVKVGPVAEDVIYAGDLYQRHAVGGVSTDTKHSVRANQETLGRGPV